VEGDERTGIGTPRAGLENRSLVVGGGGGGGGGGGRGRRRRRREEELRAIQLFLCSL